MFETNTNASETGSRRNMLKTMGGLIAGSTALAGLGAGRGAAESEEGLRIEVREMTEEYIAVEVRFPKDTYTEDVEFLDDIFLGHADRFEIHDDEEAVSLPEDTDGLAHPVEVERLDERIYEMYFRTAAVDLSEAGGEEVMLGLGVFEERTIPGTDWDACPGHRDY
ncbi:hypothetical protein [Natrinema sp. 1APR25-10V2]|uniref:hypothetical protein n=1 Tax=Natrinema sp. 1APR25-10V2 TaxID=2951081 RepID=UPI0028745989|nr:hypothetical protein [Natrinema sp. 1APR25-10V2]MDS0474144.1 hypothetical protein [Natrinema sp. 1APR25-10V2]